MPTCRDMSELVTDYLERRLPITSWLGARWHLLQCDACRRYFGQMRQTIRLSGTLSERDISPRAREELLAAFREWKPS